MGAPFWFGAACALIYAQFGWRWVLVAWVVDIAATVATGFYEAWRGDCAGQPLPKTPSQDSSPDAPQPVAD